MNYRRHYHCCYWDCRTYLHRLHESMVNNSRRITPFVFFLALSINTRKNFEKWICASEYLVSRKYAPEKIFSNRIFSILDRRSLKFSFLLDRESRRSKIESLTFLSRKDRSRKLWSKKNLILFEELFDIKIRSLPIFFPTSWVDFSKVFPANFQQPHSKI